MNSLSNSLSNLFDAQGEVFGTWSQVASDDLIDMLGAAGYAFTIVDCEHTAIGLETAERLFRSCKANQLVPLVRVPANDRVWIGRCLDAGAIGVVVPGIDSVNAAREA
jgi:4-hydroxy-2-oxoheptanedioate aldolase